MYITMTIQENAKITVERIVSEYNYEDRKNGSNQYSYWDIMKMIKHAYEIKAFNKNDAERYCYHMHITFNEMMTADN